MVKDASKKVAKKKATKKATKKKKAASKPAKKNVSAKKKSEGVASSPKTEIPAYSKDGDQIGEDLSSLDGDSMFESEIYSGI
jgi:hypothetical protein